MPMARSVLQERSCVLQTFPEAPLSGVSLTPGSCLFAQGHHGPADPSSRAPGHNKLQICTELTSF